MTVSAYTPLIHIFNSTAKKKIKGVMVRLFNCDAVMQYSSQAKGKARCII